MRQAMQFGRHSHPLGISVIQPNLNVALEMAGFSLKSLVSNGFEVSPIPYAIT